MPVTVETRTRTSKRPKGSPRTNQAKMEVKTGLVEVMVLASPSGM